MKNTIKIGSLWLLIICSGCLPGMGEWNITLYEQKIEGTSKAIYQYDAWGGRDSHESGYAVLDTNEVFTIAKIKKIRMYQLAEIPTKNGIHIVDLESVTYEEEKKLKAIFTPVKTTEFISEGIAIKSTHYQGKGFKEKSYGFYRYEFERFEETRDSLFFYNLEDIMSMKKSQMDSLRIKKGNVIIHQTQDNTLTKLVIEHLVLSTDGKSSIVSNKRYRLTPKTKTKSDQFSDYGIFKEKHIAPKNTDNE